MIRWCLVLSLVVVTGCSEKSKPSDAAGDAETTNNAATADADSQPMEEEDAATAPSNPGRDEPPDCIAETPTQIPAVPSRLGSLTWKEGADLTLDLETCAQGRYAVDLPLGSAWVAVVQSADRCELWLGGETENPRYDGSPSQYCTFLRDACEVTIVQGNGGPASLSSPACTRR
jgi:hypothetical protein